MPTPPRPDWITAVLNSMLSPEGVPVAAPDRFTTGRLGPSSMVVPCLSNRRRQQPGSAARWFLDSIRLSRCHSGSREIAMRIAMLKSSATRTRANTREANCLR